MRRLRFVPVVAVAVVTLTGAGCHLVGPSCTSETADVLKTSGTIAPTGVSTFEVASPKHSNLVIRLTWPDTDAALTLRATIVDCGEHVGCLPVTLTPSFGPGGPSPTPQPWPPGLVEMTVDGTRGKRYRIDVSGSEGAGFAMQVRYVITCES